MAVCLFAGKARRGQPLFARYWLPLFSRWHPSGLCNEIAAWDKRHQGQILGRMFQPSRYRANDATGGAGWFSGCKACAWNPDKIALPRCPVLAEKPGIASGRRDWVWCLRGRPPGLQVPCSGGALDQVWLRRGRGHPVSQGGWHRRMGGQVALLVQAAPWTSPGSGGIEGT